MPRSINVTRKRNKTTKSRNRCIKNKILYSIENSEDYVPKGGHLEFYSNDDEEIPIRKQRVVRNRPNHFEAWDGKEFFQRFRLSPQTVENVLEEIEDVLRYGTDRNNALSPSDQLLLALRFYATGSFLNVAGDFSGVHKSTASKTIKRVSHALAAMRQQIIYMPRTEEEISVCKNKFYNIARFRMCIGAIDCSHVKIQSPGGDFAETFRNRKQYFSFNVQTIADTDLKIRDIVARWPGASHDAHIFRNSVIMNSFERGDYKNCIIVGDSGYAIKPYLLTPLTQPRNAAEILYNESQIRTRNVVERSYGTWKRRFPGLALGLRLTQDTVQAVIVATAVLHNIACDENENVPVVNEEEEAAVNLVNNNPVQEQGIVNEGGMNNVTRHNLIYNHFARLN